MDEEPSPAEFLLERVINGHGGRRLNMLVVDVGYDADNPAWSRIEPDKLREPVRPHQVPIDWILPWKQQICDSRIDDHDTLGAITLGAITIGFRKIAPRDERNPERGEESRRDRSQSGARIVLRIVALAAFDRKGKAVTSPTEITPRHCVANSHTFDSRYGRQSLLKLTVETPDLFGRLSKRSNGYIHRKNTLGF